MISQILISVFTADAGWFLGLFIKTSNRMASLVMFSLADIGLVLNTINDVFQFFELLLWVFALCVTVEVAALSTTVITLSAAKGFNPGMSQVMFFQI